MKRYLGADIYGPAGTMKFRKAIICLFKGHEWRLKWSDVDHYDKWCYCERCEADAMISGCEIQCGSRTKKAIEDFPFYGYVPKVPPWESPSLAPFCTLGRFSQEWETTKYETLLKQIAPKPAKPMLS